MVLNRYITAEIIRPMFLGIAMLVVIFSGYSFALKLSDAAQGQIPVDIVARLIGLKSLISLEILLPTALYLSIISALSRFYRDSEMAAMQAAGFGEARIMRPVLLLSVLVAVIVGVISLYARPWAYRQSYQIEADARAEFDIRKIEPGRFIELQGSEYVLFARAVDQGKGRLEEVFLQSDRGEKIQVTYAREAWLPPVQPGTRRSFKFRNGYSYLLDRRGSRDTTLKFKTLLIPIPEQKRDTSYRRKAEATPTLRASSAPKDIAEYQWRVSTPFATLMLALLAVPLSRSAPRRGRHYNFILAILAYVAVFVLVSAFRTWVEDAKIPASPGLWWAYLLPMLLFVALTVFPVWQRRKR